MSSDNETPFSKKGMAVSRKEFKRSIENVFSGAAFEFLKCRINDKLEAHHTDREHWEKEWRYHLGAKLYSRFAKIMRFKDTEKAVEETLFEIERHLPTFFRYAANTMAKYRSMSPSKAFHVLDPKDGEDFMREVRDACQSCLTIGATIDDDDN